MRARAQRGKRKLDCSRADDARIVDRLHGDLDLLGARRARPGSRRPLAASAATCSRSGSSRAVGAGRARPAASTPTTLQPGQAAGGDREPARPLVGVHDLQPIDVLDDAGRGLARQRAAVADHVDLERIRAARATPPRAAAMPTSSADVDERARPEHAPRHAVAVVAAWRARSASRSGSARAGSPSCPSPGRSRRCRRRSRCTRTAGPCGCRCRSGRPARRCCSRRSRRGRPPARSALRLRAPRGSPRARVVGDDQRVLVEHHAWKRAYGHMYLQTCSRIQPALP